MASLVHLFLSLLGLSIRHESIPSTNLPSTEAASCPVNERRSDCVVPCNDCHTRGDCKFLFCNKGCDCQEGHFRNDEGKCIPASECPSKSEKIRIHAGGCKEAHCVAFCRGYGLSGHCKEAYPGGEKLCLCSK